ncbi:hypothetical protein NGUA37_00587 [Salmonella enterica]|nr:hypothetical protein NGUA37_00587 [Salmonella enterica]
MRLHRPCIVIVRVGDAAAYVAGCTTVHQIMVLCTSTETSDIPTRKIVGSVKCV